MTEELKGPDIALEPDALFCRIEKICTPDQATELSIAISLKRIADRLDDIASGTATIQVSD